MEPLPPNDMNLLGEAATMSHHGLTLVKPGPTRKSRFWTYFMTYCPDHHPEKVNFARCNLCGRDISVKQGTGGLKNHMKFKHPEENEMLDDSVTYGVDNLAVAVGEAGTPIPNSVPIAKRRKTVPTSGLSRAEEIKMKKEEHYSKMWEEASSSLNRLRQALKHEEDVDVIDELEGDIAMMAKRKADYAALLNKITKTHQADVSG
jgi:hypothetical protein|mmetsp:Transcript_6473/g.14334  ORF Transcript_6473/g.14334 Transcript_6473/m.14334 type:complete len:204 (-) Transcript_6473:127-738(-)|eukprot:g13568.t1 g13568   contig82:23754-24365(-)